MNKQNVLFLCTGNSARSQMGEALMRKHGGDRFDVYSAGTDPKGVNPLTIKALAEIGIDASGHRSEHLNEYLGKLPIQYLIIVCGHADETCPGALVNVGNRLFWPFDDPAAATGTEEEKLAAFRKIRDQIVAKIQAWLAESP
jgi:arsenate reductase (thioredoxin)